MARPRKVNELALEMSKREYQRMIDDEGYVRDDKGFIKLNHSAASIDTQSAQLTSSIESLEDKLRKYREEKQKFEHLKTTPEYKEEKKNKNKKKNKKERQNLLEMVFNNADELLKTPDEDEDDDDYEDSTKTKRAARAAAKKAEKATTLETTYGKRFSPIVSYLHESIRDFDGIAEEIEKDLKSRTGQTRGMYRSSQMGNLISAKNSKLSAIKELATVAKQINDIEYKEKKDKKGEEGDSTRAITLLGAQYLRGVEAKSIVEDDKKDKKSKDKKKDKKGKKSSSYDDSDDDRGSIKRIPSERSKKDDREQAADFAKLLLGHRKDIQLNPHEYHIGMEGKYKFVVVADGKHPENDWEFVAVDPKTDKKLKGFKDEYKELYPKKKNCRMSFNFERMKATDKNSNKTYPLIVK